MPRKRKQDIKINNTSSLEGLLQETYNDACLQINDAQSTINELSVSAIPQDVDEMTKIAKEKGGLLKIKDSAIRIKLELAKLQSDIIKNSGDVEFAISERTDGKVSVDDFKSIREMLKNDKAINNESD
jgi:polyribonucleotide nucleotidyltransferase